MTDSDEVCLTGIHTVRLALSKRKGLRQLLLTSLADKRHADLRSLAEQRQVPVKQVDQKALSRLARGVHQGVALICAAAETRDEGFLEDLLRSRKNPLLLVLDGITDPRNLGACLRSAAGFGAAAVILPKHQSAPLNAAARKAASGAEELTPLIHVANLARSLDYLKQFGIWIHALVPDPSAGPLARLSLQAGTALVLGSEEKGPRRLTLAKCDGLAHIPLAPDLGSLNVAVAAGIALYEANRQRQVDLTA